jgi:endo-1,4-beta-xylanase
MRRGRVVVGLGAVWCVVSLAGCGDSSSPSSPSPPLSSGSDNTDARPLAQAGAAVQRLVGTAVQSGLLNQAPYRDVVAREFSYLTAEYEMKWDALEPGRGAHNFSRADAIVQFAEARGMRVKGHALIWHSSTPAWAAALPPDQFRAALLNHIQTTVSRYRGRVLAWDVVNEAIADSGGLRDTVYRQKLGDDYIAEAFHAARAADPTALLLYNDYGAEGMNTKSNRVYDLVKGLREQGVPIDGVGLQMHISAASRPSDASISANMRRLADLGLLVNISEMDVKINSVPGTLSTRLEAQRAAYHDVVRLCVMEARCDAVTFWGFTDAHTWLTGEQPLLFDAQYQPKPAYSGVLDALAGR